jgi:tetratricopeptide (TPR) repeat protein
LRKQAHFFIKVVRVSVQVHTRRLIQVGLLCVSALILLFPSATAQQTLGNIVGHISVVRGDTPPESVLVVLEVRGAPMDSVYADSSGTFGFHNLGPNPYYVVVNDDHYEPVRREAVIDPSQQAPTVYLEITLVPRKKDKPDASASPSAKGANPNMIDLHEYSERFPKKALKEFEKGLSADAGGKTDDAIRHYLKAVEIAPDFYLAHNNLGSDYVSKSDFPDARKEFEQVVKLNQSDANGYFNLSNVCMLTGQLPAAQQFLDEGLRRQPDSAFGQFLLGSLNLRMNKPAQAEIALLRAIQLDPTKAQYRLQLVNLLLQQGRKDAAASQLRDLLAALPDSSYSAQARQVLQKLEASKPAAGPN